MQEKLTQQRISAPLSIAISTLMMLGCSADAGGPLLQDSGWVEHRDPAGFQVKVPQGWSTKAEKAGQVVIHNSDGSVFALLEPFKLPGGGHAAETVGPIVTHLTSLFPHARIVQQKQVSQEPDEVVARVTYGSGGQANVLCVMNGDQGILYAIGAPSRIFADKKDALVKILTSFEPVTGGGGQSEGGSSEGPISYVSWTDPHEHAFTTKVPNGWHVIGGAMRYAPIDIRRQVSMASPDGQIHVIAGDANVATFANYGPSAQMRGLHAGQEYQVNGVTYMVLNEMDGTAFSKLYVEKVLKKAHPSIEITGTQHRPEFEHELQQKLRTDRVTVGETDFTLNEKTGKREGACINACFGIGQGSSAIWVALPSIVIAAPGQLQKGIGVLHTYVQASHDNPDWTASQAQITKRFNQLIAQNHELVMQQLHDQYVKFSNALSENSRQWDNIINGEVDLRDSNGGQFKARAGSDYYWSRGGQVFGGNTPPSGAFTPLSQF